MRRDRGWVGEHDPGAGVVPVILPGFTDSRHFRQAFPDCVAYGFFPQRHQPMLATTPLVHGADERIDVRDLAFATRAVRATWRVAPARLSPCRADTDFARGAHARPHNQTMPRMVR